MLEDQIQVALSSGKISAVKIGMLGSSELALTTARILKPWKSLPIVLDPVLRASSGTALIAGGACSGFCDELFPLATLLMPNLMEAAALLNDNMAESPAAISDQAVRLLGLGPSAVLIKGGHGEGDLATDILVERGRKPLALNGRRLPGSMRGTGCALATACACLLAEGRSVLDSCRLAKRYVFEQLLVSREPVKAR
jgi:hydroxymethylpyrimidine/phosphomethylpyrimidine kinase